MLTEPQSIGDQRMKLGEPVQMDSVSLSFSQRLMGVVESNKPENVATYSQDEINQLDAGLNQVVTGLLEAQKSEGKPQLIDSEAESFKKLLKALGDRCEKIAQLDSEHSIDSARATVKRILSQIESGEIQVKDLGIKWA